MERSDFIQSLVDKGFVLTKLKGKRPPEREWQKRTKSDPVPEFGPGDNVGLILGDASGIVDIDIDSLSALRISDSFLPPTELRFGRISKRNSHRLFRVQGAGGTVQRKHPELGSIVELRGNGSQTMIPPSRHPEGEEVEFCASGEAAEAQWDELQRCVDELAIATVLEPFWTPGSRHSCCLALAGLLYRSKWPKDRSDAFVRKLVATFNDEEPRDRLDCVESTYAANQPVSGRRQLANYIGERNADCICRWAGWHDASNARDGSSTPQLKTDADCAEQFHLLFKDRLVFSLSESHWFERRNGIYVPIGEAELQSCVLECGEELKRSVDPRDIGKFFSSSGSKAIISLARSKFGVDGEDFDSDDDLLGCQNGVVNLSGDELTQHPGAAVTRRVAVPYDPRAECPLFLRFLNDIFEGKQDVIAYLQRCIGYTIQGSVAEHSMFVCIGSGLNGKSTLLNVIAKLMGDYAGTLPMSSLMERKNDNRPNYEDADLKGKRFVACQEGEVGSKLAEARVKLLTGGDKLPARQIYSRQVEFWPTHKLWLATNELPRVDGTSEGIWRRMENIIRFPVTIPKEKVDRDLGSKLANELSGILNFAIEGYHDWKAQGLSRPFAIDTDYKQYRSECDTVGGFIEDCCLPQRGAKAYTADLHAHYETWCVSNGLTPLSRAMFGKTMGQKGYESFKESKQNVWKGITLIEDFLSSTAFSRSV